jgi:hypothetical protein
MFSVALDITNLLAENYFVKAFSLDDTLSLSQLAALHLGQTISYPHSSQVVVFCYLFSYKQIKLLELLYIIYYYSKVTSKKLATT